MIECIPNFSEGRRREVIDAIAAAIAAVPGVLLLDMHIDADHNRSVITFAAPADSVGEAAFQGIKIAAQQIDLTQHSGQHPRIGAADVVPFVPLRGATEAQCVDVARALGARLGAELRLPVYLYGAAATHPDRRELPDIRRGGYEGLRAAIGSDPARAPDFGPRALGPAGATALGVRSPLIAFNLYLDTDDVQIARQIARAVRGSSGGLPHVRALGLLVHGRAQVSMNLTDYRVTPVHAAVERVEQEAARHGTTVIEGELVGLIPEDALLHAGRHALRIEHTSDAQILERRLAQVAHASNWHATSEQLRSSDSQGDTRPLSFVEQADAIWQQAVQALAAAARELAESEHNEQTRVLLRAISQTLPQLLQHAATDDARVMQALLLLARMAARLSSLLATETQGNVQTMQHAVYLAHDVAASARLWALARRASEEQRQGIEELHSYVEQTRAAMEKIERVYL